jgi:hypothetical protein
VHFSGHRIEAHLLGVSQDVSEGITPGGEKQTVTGCDTFVYGGAIFLRASRDYGQARRRVRIPETQGQLPRKKLRRSVAILATYLHLSRAERRKVPIAVHLDRGMAVLAEQVAPCANFLPIMDMSITDLVRTREPRIEMTSETSFQRNSGQDLFRTVG